MKMIIGIIRKTTPTFLTVNCHLTVRSIVKKFTDFCFLLKQYLLNLKPQKLAKNFQHKFDFNNPLPCHLENLQIKKYDHC